MKDLTFTAEIVEENGKKRLQLGSSAYFKTMIQKLKVGKYSVKLSDTLPYRSNNQNSFYWGVCLQLIAEEHGDDVNDLHEIFKQLYLPPKFITVMGKAYKVPKSTTELNTIEFGDYLRKIERDSGVEFPDPTEAGYVK